MCVCVASTNKYVQYLDTWYMVNHVQHSHVPTVCMPTDRPRNLVLVRMDAFTNICLAGHSA